MQALASAAIPHRLGESARSGHSIDYRSAPMGLGRARDPKCSAITRYYLVGSHRIDTIRLLVTHIGCLLSESISGHNISGPQLGLLFFGTGSACSVCTRCGWYIGPQDRRPWSEGRRTSAWSLYISILCGVQVGSASGSARGSERAHQSPSWRVHVIRC